MPPYEASPAYKFSRRTLHDEAVDADAVGVVPVEDLLVQLLLHLVELALAQPTLPVGGDDEEVGAVGVGRRARSRRCRSRG